MDERAHDLRRTNAYQAAGYIVAARRLDLVVVGVDASSTVWHDVSVTYHQTATQAALAAGEDRAALAHGLYTDVKMRMAGIAAQTLAGCPPDPGGDIAAFAYADRLACLNAGWPVRNLRLDPNQPRGPVLQKYEDEANEAVRQICLEAGFELVPDELPEFTIHTDKPDDDDVDLGLSDADLVGADAAAPTGGQKLRNDSCAIVSRAEEDITALLQANWQAVEAVADALVKHDRLSPAELDHIIRSGSQ